jgi:hypothetical protein
MDLGQDAAFVTVNLGAPGDPSKLYGDGRIESLEKVAGTVHQTEALAAEIWHL